MKSQTQAKELLGIDSFWDRESRGSLKKWPLVGRPHFSKKGTHPRMYGQHTYKKGIQSWVGREEDKKGG